MLYAVQKITNQKKETMKTKTAHFKIDSALKRRVREEKPKNVFMRDWWTVLIVAGLEAVKK